MDQYWVCQHCKSLNRAGTGKCYRCKEKLGSRAPSGVTAPAARAPEPPPLQPAIRQDLTLNPEAPAYLSRPLSSTPTAGPIRLSDDQPMPWRAPRSPLATLKSRLSSAITGRLPIGITGLGYFTAAALGFFAIAALVLVANAAPLGLDVLQHSDPASAWDRLGYDAQARLITAGAAAGGLGAVNLVLFSILIGLSTGNAPGLGADLPMLSPSRAAICWLRAIWRQFELGVALIAPAVLVWLGWPIPGLIVAIGAIEIAERRLEDAFGWMLAPARHLPDLYLKLGTEGSIDSSLAWLWSVCYRAAHVLAMVMLMAPAFALLATYAAGWSGHGTVIPGWQTGSLGPAQLSLVILAAGLVATAAGSVVLAVPLTVGLVRRQAARRIMVKTGRGRQWAGQAGRAFQKQEEGPAWTRAGYADPEDRVVERYPKAASLDDSMAPLR